MNQEQINEIKRKAIFGQECNDDSCATCKSWDCEIWNQEKMEIGCSNPKHPREGEHPCSDWEKK